MIVGVGCDIVDIKRIEEALERFGEQFEQRSFTPAEREQANRRNSAGKHHKAATLAKRFAAKEACAKALGTGFTQGISWQDIEVGNTDSGAPTLTLSGGAARVLGEKLPAGMKAVLHVSLADDYPLAQAYVMIEARS